MAKRIKVVLNYQYNENWIGGSYYIQNLIHALNVLEDNDKPLLFINSTNEHVIEDLFSLTNFPYLRKYPKLNKFQKGMNLLTRLLIKRNVHDFRSKVDAIFPASFDEYAIRDKNFLKYYSEKYSSFKHLVNIFIGKKPLQGGIYTSEIFTKKKIFWIPDFQDKYLPEFFDSSEIIFRDNMYKEIHQKATSLVFSSQDAKKDFNKFYPNAKPNQFVLNFASFHTNDNLPTREFILKKYNIKSDYFLCSNQFWKHKNHIVILKSIALLKSEGIAISVVFTGKEIDNRNPEYFKDLKNIVKELNISDNVIFLGFIDRIDQIVLLKNCIAIIQPTLFEGWSTVNEDAKAENIFILASNLNVNKEQLIDYPNHRLFDPMDEKSLANEIRKGYFEVCKIEYQNTIKKFGGNFLEIVNSLTKYNE